MNYAMLQTILRQTAKFEKLQNCITEKVLLF